MAWALAVFVAFLLLALIAFCTVNAVRIIRDMNKTVGSFRKRLEDEANTILDGLFNASQGEDSRFH